jgi:hypothetical protein
MKKIQSIATIFVFLNLTGWALGQTVVPLNTGFNHSTGLVYPVGGADNYWINLATSPPTAPPAGPAWAIQWQTPWLPALPVSGSIPGTSWISAWNTIGGQVDPVTGIGLSIFRKCFCLMSFTQAKLAFDVRADDNITVWLNTTLNTILPASQGHYNAAPLQAGTTDQSKFHIGVNCLYVLLENTGGYMGFDLRGTVSAYGLMPMPAFGTQATFEPCGCDSKGGPKSDVKAEIDDGKVVQEILKIAEARRAAKGKPGAK